MTFREEKENFDKTVHVAESGGSAALEGSATLKGSAALESAATSAMLAFRGVDGFDVYNCSIPFTENGTTYIFGRVEKRDEWAASHVRLFAQTAPDEFTVVPGAMMYPLEDPYIARIHGEFVMGGTHVRKKQGEIDTFYAYFYRGKDAATLDYFTTGPDCMKDIRLVELADGRIGVFSRPRGEHIRARYGSESVIGFTTIDRLDALCDDVVESAKFVPGLFDADEWGGCNQCYLLPDGKVGVIGHKGYHESLGEGKKPLQVYVNVAFVFDPATHAATPPRVIGTRKMYGAAEPKIPELRDCVFASGIVPRADAKADLYSGVCDTAEGRVVIDNPFA